jgi:hypothetical protein
MPPVRVESPVAAVVEVTDGKGAALTIRMMNYGSLDVAGLVEAFWKRAP